MEIYGDQSRIYIYPFPKRSSAKYIVTKLPDEGMCVPWVQNGDAQYMMSKYLSYIY